MAGIGVGSFDHGRGERGTIAARAGPGRPFFFRLTRGGAGGKTGKRGHGPGASGGGGTEFGFGRGGGVGGKPQHHFGGASRGSAKKNRAYRRRGTAGPQKKTKLVLDCQWYRGGHGCGKMGRTIAVAVWRAQGFFCRATRGQAEEEGARRHPKGAGRVTATGTSTGGGGGATPPPFGRGGLVAPSRGLEFGEHKR